MIIYLRNVLDDVLNVEEGSTYEASLQNNISPCKQDDSEQFAKSDESQNQNMTLDKDKSIVGSNDEYQDLVELENQVNKFDEISSSPSNDIWEHDIENTNEKNDDENDKGTVNDVVININKGDEENNEEYERSGVDTEDNNSAVSNITVGNDDVEDSCFEQIKERTLVESKLKKQKESDIIKSSEDESEKESVKVKKELIKGRYEDDENEESLKESEKDGLEVEKECEESLEKNKKKTNACDIEKEKDMSSVIKEIIYKRNKSEVIHGKPNEETNNNIVNDFFMETEASYSFYERNFQHAFSSSRTERAIKNAISLLHTNDISVAICVNVKLDSGGKDTSRESYDQSLKMFLSSNEEYSKYASKAINIIDVDNDEKTNTPIEECSKLVSKELTIPDVHDTDKSTNDLCMRTSNSLLLIKNYILVESFEKQVDLGYYHILIFLRRLEPKIHASLGVNQFRLHLFNRACGDNSETIKKCWKNKGKVNKTGKGSWSGMIMTIDNEGPIEPISDEIFKLVSILYPKYYFCVMNLSCSQTVFCV